MNFFDCVLDFLFPPVCGICLKRNGKSICDECRKIINYKSINKIEKEDEELIGKIFTTIKKVAKDQGIAESGYRVVSNCGKDAGQTVMHLHFHILGGKTLGEKVL